MKKQLQKIGSHVRCDIIVPVYNSPRQVRTCLESLHAVLDNTRDRIVVINDCSDAFTTAYLRSLDFIRLVENTENLGFLGSANKGLLSSDAAYVCLLNSDTMVTDPEWLDKMIIYAENNPTVGLITPLSNEAVNLSLKLHPGSDVHLMTDIVNTTTRATYPDAVTIVGFCMLVRQTLIQKIGGFDTIFGKGYCEESDYHYRAIAAGFSCKVADNVFVYHEGEASFSGERSSRYTKNRKEFDKRWGKEYLADTEQFIRLNALGYMRKDDLTSVLPLVHDVYDIIFVLPSLETYGGVIVVVDLVNELIRMGVKANIVCFTRTEKPLAVSRYFEPLIIAEKDIPDLIPRAHIYTATHYRTAVAVFCSAHHYGSKALYLIQDDERMFENEDAALVNASFRLIPNHVYVARWLEDTIGSCALYKKVISNGIYRDLFYQESEPIDEKAVLHIAMMTRQDIKRGFYEGMAAINRLLSSIGAPMADRLHFHFFGNREVFPHEIQTDKYTYHGIVSRSGVASILRKSDIFVDPSHFQGFGLTALEAMSSGCAVLLPDKGGANDFVHPFENALFFRAKDIDHLYEMLCLVLTCTSLRVKLQKNAVNLPRKFSLYHSSREYRSIIDDAARLAEVLPKDSKEYLLYKLQMAESQRFEYIRKDMQLRHLQYENTRLRERLHHYMGLCRAEQQETADNA